MTPFQGNFILLTHRILIAAKHGFKYAQHKMGSCYFNGKGVEKNRDSAIKWWTLASKQNVALSQYNLAYQCQDKEEQFKWYKSSAELGYLHAQQKLGNCYLNGIGCEKNEELGQDWIYKSQELLRDFIYE